MHDAILNKTALFYGPRDVRIEDVPVAPLKPGEVLVRVAAATTCGTDKKTFERGHPVIIKTVPSAFGHEMAGTIAQLGPGVSGFQVSDRVVVANSAPCFDCFYCQKGSPNLCENITFLNGSYAQYLTVPAPIVRHNLHKIPDHVDLAKVALSEPLACVLHACEHMQIKSGETVAILGTGPMSFLFLEVLKSLQCPVIVVGRNAKRLALAEKCGAVIVNSAKIDMTQGVAAVTGGYGADVAIEAIGQPFAWEAAVSLVRKGGRVCVYGGCAKNTTFTLDTYRMHYEQITVSGIFHHTPPLFKKAVSWIVNDQIDLSLFTRERRKLEDLTQILSGQDKVDALKYVIEP